MPIINRRQYVHDEKLPEKLSSYKVTFSDIDFPIVDLNSKIGNNHYIVVNKDNGSTIELSKPLINAIDIDWNSAYLTYTKDVIIKHSGDLLALIDSISYTAYVSSEVISYLSYRIDKIPEDIQPGGGGTVNEEDVLRIILSTEYRSDVEGFTGENGLVTAGQVRGEITTSILNELVENPILHDAFDGKSAFEIARENGGPDFDTLYPNEAAWVESLHGKDGEDGKSAYEIAAAIGGEDFANRYANEADWIEHGLKTTVQIDGVEGVSILTEENFEGEIKYAYLTGFLKLDII